MGYLILFLLFTHGVSVLVLYYKTRGSSLTASFTLALLLQAVIPAFLTEPLAEYQRITLNEDVIETMTEGYLVYVLIVFFFLLVSFLAPKVIKKRRGDMLVSDSYTIKDSFVVFFFMIGIFEFLILIIDGKFQFILSQSINSLTSDNYKDLRVNIIEEGYSNYQSSVLNYLKIICSSGTSFAYLLFLYTANVNTGFFRKNFWITVFFGIVVFTMALSGFEKGPIALFIIITFLVRYNNKIKQFGYLKLSLGFAGINLIAALLIMVTTGFAFFESFFFLYYRVFLEPTTAAYMHFAVFPDSIDWVRFSNFNLVRTLFDVKPVLANGAISLDVAETFTGQYYSMNGNLVPTGWAQLGFYGIVIYTLIAFILFTIVDFITIRFTVNASVGVLRYFYLFWFIYFANTSIENFILSSGCVFWPIFMIYSTRKITV